MGVMGCRSENMGRCDHVVTVTLMRKFAPTTSDTGPAGEMKHHLSRGHDLGKPRNADGMSEIQDQVVGSLTRRCRFPVDSGHPITTLRQVANEVSANEPRCTCDDRMHGRDANNTTTVV